MKKGSKAYCTSFLSLEPPVPLLGVVRGGLVPPAFKALVR